MAKKQTKKKGPTIKPEPTPPQSDAQTQTAEWQDGPLPPDTWNWGGVVPVGEEDVYGFYFADFCGDHVKICPGGRILKPEEVARYNNCLELPDRTKAGTRLEPSPRASDDAATTEGA